MKGEKIGFDPLDRDMWLCICGNTLEQSGFHPCSADGTELSPVEVRGKQTLYRCADCDRIFDPKSREVVGMAQGE